MEFDLENPLPTTQDTQLDTVTSLFHIESDHMPSNTYPQNLKAPDIYISVRHETISLILHFSQNFDPFLSYLATNYLHRFLSTQAILEWKPWIGRLLAVSCVSLALKMRKTEFFVTDIQRDGGFIFDAVTIRRMEFLILGALKWRMRSITPFSFINFFISLFKFKDPPLRQALKSRAIEIIFKAQNEFKLLEFKPSIVAASALLSASHELFPLQFSCFSKAISDCVYVHTDNFLKCYNVMEEMVMEGYESVFDAVSSSGTPVTVLDRQCSISCSFNSQKTNPCPAEAIATPPTVRLKSDVKRRGFGNDNKFQLSQIQQC